uniref:Uncharacterized protein n=1 Tax=Minutocellus polymorphus TaxID=265543 RepID=A0A6U4E444_9STRA|mmetsp:Transcript_9536/g.15838  ORF Transcript_9536/g.15838 Transcript_9536/m.15838 type:complete len:187 (+) Transcript_9536:141-701(+)
MGIDVMPPKDTEEPPKTRLLHESLNKIPQGPRFGISGALCNVIFIAGFNACVEAFESPDMPASRIYSLFYCAYIPVGHAINSLLVFGWPEKYLPSLMSNAPIGLTAMMLGTILTGYFDRINFEHIADQFLINNFYWAGFTEPEPDEERSEFYSSIMVMIITGVWSYLLSMWVNAAPAKKKLEGKEL